MNYGKFKEEIVKTVKFFFGWKLWLASLFVIAVNGAIALGINVLYLLSGEQVSLTTFSISWCTAIFASIIWIMLIVWSRKKHEP